MNGLAPNQRTAAPDRRPGFRCLAAGYAVAMLRAVASAASPPAGCFRHAAGSRHTEARVAYPISCEEQGPANSRKAPELRLVPFAGGRKCSIGLVGADGIEPPTFAV
jgi:hypothetical protein